jgi:hypothetical protein
MRSILITLVVGLVLAIAPAAFADSPTFVIHKSIGDIRMGEAEQEVVYEYGDDCLSGCPGIQYGTNSGVTFFRYKVAGGELRVAYRSRHVIFVETTSPRYKTSTGLHVGSVIPYGKTFGVFHFTPTWSSGDWTAGTSWSPPLYKHPASRWWTSLAVNRGKVIVMSIARGDVPN